MELIVPGSILTRPHSMTSHQQGDQFPKKKNNNCFVAVKYTEPIGIDPR